MTTESKQSHNEVQAVSVAGATPADKNARIHPIVMYPYTQPDQYHDLDALYKALKPLTAQTEKFVEPLTVVNRQTFYNNARYKFDENWNRRFREFQADTVGKHSKVIDAWSVDTCQMWLAGLGAAYDAKVSGDDVYWIIPGDFNFAAKSDVLKKLEALPEAVFSHDQDFAVGEISPYVRIVVPPA